MTENSKVSGWLYTSVSANETINKRTGGIMVPVTSGDTNIDGSSKNTPDGGKVTITLLGKARYVHEYVQLNYDVYRDMTNSDSATFLPPTLNAIVLSWIDVKGGTTLPQTDVV
jgi:E3 ubiquitin-protein ligase DOA10